MKKYGIGAVGAGDMGMGHVKAMAECPGLELKYICDLSEERLKAASEYCPSARLTGDYDEILADESVHVVSINTLSNIRPDMIRKALAAKKHVVCEKPLAPTAAEARNLVDDVRKTDRLVTVNLFNRNAPYLHEAMEFIRSGEIGELAIMRINHCTPGRSISTRSGDTHRAVEGHVLHDCGMHYVDVMRWFAGSEYRDFTSRAVRLWDSEFELYFMVNGSFENNIAFEFHNSFCYASLAATRRNYSGQEFIGTHGVVTLTHNFNEVSVKMNGRTRTIEKIMPYEGKKLHILYARFAEALENNDLGQLPRMEDAVKASEVAQEMVDRAVEGSIPNFGSKSDLSSR